MASAKGDGTQGEEWKSMTTWQKAREILWGLFFFDYWKEMVSIQKKYEDAINLILLGEILGLPFMQSIFTLRLLPYLFKDIPPWKFRALREFDILEAAPELH